MSEATYTYAALGFLALCLAAWFWLERDRARRAERLIAATRRMAAGDLDARAGVRGHDELGVLADAVAQMAARLKTLGATYQERQNWFGLLLEHSSDLILTLDAEWHIGFASPSLPRFLGWPMDQMVRRPLAEFLHPDDAEAVLAAFRAISARPEPGEPIAFRLLHVDGSWRSVEAIAGPPRNWSGAERRLRFPVKYTAAPPKSSSPVSPATFVTASTLFGSPSAGMSARPIAVAVTQNPTPPTSVATGRPPGTRITSGPAGSDWSLIMEANMKRYGMKYPMMDMLTSTS